MNGIVINPFGKYIQMSRQMIELLLSGYDYYEQEKKANEESEAQDYGKND